MGRKGFTLIEVLVASTLLTAALAMIWQVWLNSQQTTEILGKKMTATEATVHAMDIIRREIRQASRASIETLPEGGISYQMVTDVDGDGLPISTGGVVELSPARVIKRDNDDRNNDGIRDSQLVLIAPEGVRVLANGLSPQDGSGGILFEPSGPGVRVRIEVAGSTRRKLIVGAIADETITPRNP